MGAKNFSGVRRITRAGRKVWTIDFRYSDLTGAKKRYARDAPIQTSAAAHAEAKKLQDRAAKTGSPFEVKAVAKPKARGLTFQEFVAGPYERDYMSVHRPATTYRYRALLKQVVLKEFGGKLLDEISSADYRTFAASELRRGVQPKGALNLVRSVLRAAEEKGLIDAAPALPKGLIKVSKKLPSAPSEEEVSMMLTADGWIRTAIYLAAKAGLRAGEVRALEIQDVDLVHGVINIRRAVSGDASDAASLTPKSGHERIVPMTPDLALHLASVMKSKLPRARVVTNGTGVTPKRQELLHVHKRALLSLGVKAWSFHALRHHFISELIRRGAGVEAVRTMAGHGSLAVTNRYSHATGADLRDAINLLG